MAVSGWKCVFALLVVAACGATRASAATIYVAAGADLQDALDAAQPGDTLLLAEGAEFVGNFVLRAKAGDGWITVRTSAPDALLPRAGARIQPAHAPLLARLRSPNASAVLRTAPAAHHWDLRYLELAGNVGGASDIIQIGDGSSAQNRLDLVPHHISLGHLYIHGHPVYGQKRGIALNGADVIIRDSHVSDCKAVGQDTQAIGGWNGPGPFLIENNYLEATGENVLFGGADPAIPYLVPTGITVRRNHLSRPMAWRDPILGTPAGVTATPEAGGTLTAGTYAYRVVARVPAGPTAIARSSASTEATATVAAVGGAVRVRWTPVPGATEYRVYGRTSGSQAVYWRVTVAEFVDTGLTGGAEKVPTGGGTVWSVKNLFELKSARHVVVEDNILENHWKESQPGYAIVLTPRNSNGGCTWCVVEHVRFEYNVVRNVAAGINLTGYDIPSRPTRQSNDIVIRHNLFTGMSTTLGGNGWFLLIGDAPRDVTIEHNTIDSSGTTVVYSYGGTSTAPAQILGFRMAWNAARHGTYGINGTFYGYGNGILANYYPDAVFTGNYLAGGPASRYPAGNLFAGAFQDQFGSEAGDYAVRGTSALSHAAPDGLDVGVDYATLVSRVDGVDTGISPSSRDTILAPGADFTVACTYLECAMTDGSAAGTAPIASRSWAFGDGTGSIDPSVVHTYASPGSYTVTLSIVDAYGFSAQMSKTVIVEAPNAAPAAAFTAACVDLVCTFTDASTDTDGRIVGWQWAVDGATASTRAASHRFTSPGTYDASLTVTDDDGATATYAASVQVTALLHAALSAGTTIRWDSRWTAGVHYWSADIPVAAHGADERPIAGATITAAWTGAVTKTATCVTGAAGTCTFKSGTLSMHRSTVTLTVTGVAAPLSVYGAAATHTAAGTQPAAAVTLVQP
jgi:PKD repeat protein